MSRLAWQFLETVWSKQPDYGGTDYALCSRKDWDTGAWSDHPNRDSEALLYLIEESLNDLYFAPCLFSQPARQRKHACRGRWLYADLDEVDPYGLDDHIRPTVAWETSPGRYQAMWLLDRAVAPRTLEKLNQRLTYYTGADKGGWSLTKVLRVPGSVSTKYGKPIPVKLLWSSGPVYKVHDLVALLRDVEVGSPLSSKEPLPKAWPDRDDTYRRHRKRIGTRARQLINTKTVVRGDDRSARLWELEHLLLDAGLNHEEVLVLVKASVWNKYKGQRREHRMLWGEILKASAYRADQKKATKAKRKATQRKQAKKKRKPERPELVSFRDFMTRSLPRPTWLVEGIWSEAAHGLLAGEPKTFKTLFGLDLSVSVTSGTPFLGRFPVPRTGPVFYIQEENTPGDMQDRLMRIAASRGVGPNLSHNGQHDAVLDFGHDLAIYLLNNQGFSLTDEEWLEWLERRIRKYRPVLCIFDPLYLVAKGVDENSAAEMTPILSSLLKLKQRYDCGMMIVHHYNKPKSEATRRMATRMSGTGVFHRWLASAIYVERPDETQPIVKISGEHRSHGSAGAYRVAFDLGEDDDLHYAADVEPWRDDNVMEHDPKQELLDLVLSLGDEATVTDIAEELDITPNAVRSRARKAGITIKQTKVNGRKRSVLVPEGGE